MPVRNGDNPEPLGGQTTQCRAPPPLDELVAPVGEAPRRPLLVLPPDADPPPDPAASPLPPPLVPLVAAALALPPAAALPAEVVVGRAVAKLGSVTAPPPAG